MKTFHTIGRSFGLALFLLVFALSTASRAEPNGSPRALIRNYLLASEMLKRCPSVSTSSAMVAKRDTIETFGQFLIDSLSIRASKVSPGTTPASAAGQIRRWMDRQARDTNTYQLCTMATNIQLQKIIAGFNRADVRRWLQAYAARSDVKIEPVPLQKNRILQTYALPEFQQVALDTIAKSHSSSQCKHPFIENIELIRKKKTPTANRPVYVQDAINVIEKWEFFCAGRRDRVEVTFSRDNDGMIGIYSIGDK